MAQFALVTNSMSSVCYTNMLVTSELFHDLHGLQLRVQTHSSHTDRAQCWPAVHLAAKATCQCTRPCMPVRSTRRVNLIACAVKQGAGLHPKRRAMLQRPPARPAARCSPTRSRTRGSARRRAPSRSPPAHAPHPPARNTPGPARPPPGAACVRAAAPRPLPPSRAAAPPPRPRCRRAARRRLWGCRARAPRLPDAGVRRVAASGAACAGARCALARAARPGAGRGAAAGCRGARERGARKLHLAPQAGQ